MIGYFIIPMTSPSYSRANPQKPLYCDKLGWFGSPLFKQNVYLIKASGTKEQLDELALQKKVERIEFDEDARIDDLTASEKGKLNGVLNSLKLEVREGETVGEFINRIAQSEGNNWDRKKVYVGE